MDKTTFVTKVVIVYTIINLMKLSSANENTVFVYNRIESCKPTEYYDRNYFFCRECDPQSNLMPSENGKNMK